MADPIDFSQTERIVLLIDLQPLSVLQNPESYIRSVLAASRTILTFSSISSSLVSFKLFFSSLSPIRSSSTVHRLLKNQFSNSISFDDALTSFDNLHQVLNSLTRCSSIYTELATSPSRASYMASSLLQLVHDYAWEKLPTEDLPGTLNFFPKIRQNLVLLFSPAEGVLKCSSESMNVETVDSILNETDCKKFSDSFSSVKDAYSIRDIHFSWIDVVLSKECNQENIEVGKIESVIKSLRWGFSSTNSIVLGSSLVPFRLVYPSIGCSLNFKGCNVLNNVIRSQLSLEIADVSGKPLQCNLCDLDLLNVMVPGSTSPDIMATIEATGSESEPLELDKRFLANFCGKITTLKIKSLFRCDDRASVECRQSKLVLVRERSRESGSNGKKLSDCLVADRVLEMLSCEMSGFIPMNRAPCWQILLSYLGRGGYMALVSLCNGNGNTFMGILRPYTAHLALLSILTDNMEGKVLESDDPHILKQNVDNPDEFIDSQPSAGNNVLQDARKAKRSQKHMYRELKWNSFHEEAYNGSVMELEELYFTKELKNSKKLKFLKCWIKQSKKLSACSMTLQKESKSQPHVDIKGEEGLAEPCEAIHPSPSSQFSARPHSVQQETDPSCYPETSEDFFSSLTKKINEGFECEGMDMKVLAERLVNMSIQWLVRQSMGSNCSMTDESLVKSDNYCKTSIVDSLMKMLLKTPKEMKQKSTFPHLHASNPESGSPSMENLVKEYELQILFRMEILRSEAAEGIKSSRRRKLVKHVCMFLEVIQYLVEGGFHGRLSLYDYVERTIRKRYYHVLENVVNKIYTQMDMLPFGDVEEDPVHLFNSENSLHSLEETDEMDESDRNVSASAEEDYDNGRRHQNDIESNGYVNQDKQAHKLVKARERRERDRRLVSFTTWLPDLQRVWAPKQTKQTKKFESMHKKTSRRQNHHSSRDMVSETPMSINDQRQRHRESCNNSTPSVYKSLFQDEQ